MIVDFLLLFRQGEAKFTPQNINPYLCTHLIYAFGGLGKDDTIQPFDSYQDIEQGQKVQIVKILVNYFCLKIMRRAAEFYTFHAVPAPKLLF
jgi:GH18 family chitinase